MSVPEAYMSSRIRLAMMIAAALVISSSAVASSVYLNGVNIDGVTDQKFEKCTVRIDSQGNVFIDAPGYAAKVMQGGSAPTQPLPAPPQASTTGPQTLSAPLARPAPYDAAP